MIKLDRRNVSKTLLLLFSREMPGGCPSVEISWLLETQDPGAWNDSGVDMESFQHLSVASVDLNLCIWKKKLTRCVSSRGCDNTDGPFVLWPLERAPPHLLLECGVGKDSVFYVLMGIEYETPSLAPCLCWEGGKRGEVMRSILMFRDRTSTALAALGKRGA